MTIAPKLSIESYSNILERIDSQLEELLLNQNDNSNILQNYISINKLSKNLDYLRKQTYKYNNFSDLNTHLRKTDKSLYDLKFELEFKLSSNYNSYQTKIELKRQEEKELDLQNRRASNSSSLDLKVKEIEDESIDTLRQRLLSTKDTPSQLDQLGTIEDQNTYHDNFQQELIDSLPSMVFSLKQQAFQFQEVLKQDAVILKEASENFEHSSDKFGTVNQLLSKYHKEGKLSIWFYIRVMVGVFVASAFFLVLIRLIPARY